MPNYILQIILKGKENRTITDNVNIIRFINFCTNREFMKYYQLSEIFK